MERWRDGESASMATLFDHGFIVQLLHLADRGFALARGLAGACYGFASAR